MSHNLGITEADRAQLQELNVLMPSVLEQVPALAMLKEVEGIQSPNPELTSSAVTARLARVISESASATAQDVARGSNTSSNQSFVEAGTRLLAACTPHSSEQVSLNDIERDCPDAIGPTIHITVGGSRLVAEVMILIEQADESYKIERFQYAEGNTHREAIAEADFNRDQRTMSFDDFVGTVASLINDAVIIAEASGCFSKDQLKAMSISLGQPQQDEEVAYGVDSVLKPPLNKFWVIEGCENQHVGKAVMDKLQEDYGIELEAVDVGNDTFYPGEDRHAIEKLWSRLKKAKEMFLRQHYLGRWSNEAELQLEARRRVRVLDIRGVTGEGANLMAKLKKKLLLNLEVGGWQDEELQKDPILQKARQLGLLTEDKFKLEYLLSGGYVVRRFAAALDLLRENDPSAVGEIYINDFIELINRDNKAAQIMDLLVLGRQDEFCAQMQARLGRDNYEVSAQGFKNMRAVANLVMQEAARAQAVMFAAVIRAQAEEDPSLYDVEEGILPHTGTLFFKGKVAVENPYTNQLEYVSYGEAALREAERILKEGHPPISMKLHAAHCKESKGGAVAAMRQLQRVLLNRQMNVPA